MARIPVIGVVGGSDSGRIGFAEKLIAEFRRRGYRIGVIKHAVDEIHLDTKGKDSWRYFNSGANSVILSSPNKVAMIENLFVDKPDLNDLLVKFTNELDIIITEGFKHSGVPKIVVARGGAGNDSCEGMDDVIGIAGDERKEGTVPKFNINNCGEIADYLEKKYLK